MNLALSPLFRKYFFIQADSIQSISNENLPSYYQSHPKVQNISVSINETQPISGFTYTDQWIQFLDNLNTSYSKNIILELTKEEFINPGCFIVNHDKIFPLLEEIEILPIFISGDLNYYQSLLNENSDYLRYLIYSQLSFF